METISKINSIAARYNTAFANPTEQNTFSIYKEIRGIFKRTLWSLREFFKSEFSGLDVKIALSDCPEKVRKLASETLSRESEAPSPNKGAFYTEIIKRVKADEKKFTQNPSIQELEPQTKKLALGLHRVVYAATLLEAAILEVAGSPAFRARQELKKSLKEFLLERKREVNPPDDQLQQFFEKTLKEIASTVNGAAKKVVEESGPKIIQKLMKQETARA